MNSVFNRFYISISDADSEIVFKGSYSVSKFNHVSDYIKLLKRKIVSKQKRFSD